MVVILYYGFYIYLKYLEYCVFMVYVHAVIRWNMSDIIANFPDFSLIFIILNCILSTE